MSNPALDARLRDVLTELLCYVEGVAAGTVAHDRTKLVAMLTEYGALCGRQAMEELRDVVAPKDGGES